jgi:hypothetical protein
MVAMRLLEKKKYFSFPHFFRNVTLDPRELSIQKNLSDLNLSPPSFNACNGRKGQECGQENEFVAKYCEKESARRYCEEETAPPKRS